MALFEEIGQLKVELDWLKKAGMLDCGSAPSRQLGPGTEGNTHLGFFFGESHRMQVVWDRPPADSA